MRKLLFVLVTLPFFTFGLSQNLPRILLTNDDGIDAPGLVAMHKALSRVGRVTVAAPATNQSAAGHGLTTERNPIFVTTWTDEGGSVWHSITARPATCVSLALENLLSDRPDIVVSGINQGANLGLVTYYSGTVGAAREAAFRGIPSIAISVQAGSPMDFEAAAEFTAHLVEDYLKEKLPPQTFINVNYPALPRDQVKGVKINSLSLAPPPKRLRERNPARRAKLFLAGLPAIGEWSTRHRLIGPPGGLYHHHSAAIGHNGKGVDPPAPELDFPLT